MGKKLVVVYEEKDSGPGYYNAKDIVSILEKLKNKDDVEVKDYSFENFAEKDDNDVKFWKALIIIKDANNFQEKVRAVTKKFDAEEGGDFRVLVASGAPLPASPTAIDGLKIIYTTNAVDVASWWPRVLSFLFPRKPKENSTLSCLFLFDGDMALQNTEEFAWYQRMKAVLEQIGMRCMWMGDLGNKNVFISSRNQTTAHVQPESVKPDFLVILSRNGGTEMFQKTGYQIRRKIKTLVLTDDKKSHVCKELDRSIEKIYFYQSDNPLDLDLVGWAGLLREIKLVECRDIVFTAERNMKRIMLIIAVLIIIFIVLPLILAIIAALAFLCYCGVDVGQLVDCCCCICNCFCECSSYCVGCFIDIPCCFWCCFYVGVVNDEPFPRSEDETQIQSVQVIQTTTVVQPQGIDAKRKNSSSSSSSNEE